MNLNEINSRITFYTGAGTTQYASADRVIAINKAIDDVQTMILQSQDEWDFDDKNNSNFPILTTNLVANQQPYALPSDTLKVKRLEVTYDGTNWRKVHPIDVNEIAHATDATSVKNNFSQDNPFYDLQSTQLMLYPIPDADVTGGIKIWTERTMTAFTSSDLSAGTATPGFDRQFHEMVALSVALDWAIAKGTQNRDILKGQLSEYEQRLKQYYGDKQLDRVFSLNSAYSDSNFE
jgi:hypothetical protein